MRLGQLDGKVLTIQVLLPSLSPPGTSLTETARFLLVAVEVVFISPFTVLLHALVVLGFLVGGAGVVSASSFTATFAAFFVEAAGFFLVVEDPPGAFFFAAVLVGLLTEAVGLGLPFAVALGAFSMSAVTAVVGASSFAAGFSSVTIESLLFAVGSRGG